VIESPRAGRIRHATSISFSSGCDRCFIRSPASAARAREARYLRRFQQPHPRLACSVSQCVPGRGTIRQPHQPRSIRPHHSGRRSGPSALISEHDTAAEAFAEIDRLSAQMLRTGAPSDAVELFVVNVAGEIVARPVTH
jgi:hypothetical protein